MLFFLTKLNIKPRLIVLDLCITMIIIRAGSDYIPSNIILSAIAFADLIHVIILSIWWHIVNRRPLKLHGLALKTIYS